MAKGLPILWWMDAEELGGIGIDKKSNKYKLIIERIALFEQTSEDYNQLKLDIQAIIDKSE